jgi:hypothetical protein
MCVVAENIWVTAAAPQNSVITFPPSVNPNSAAILHQHSGWQNNSFATIKDVACIALLSPKADKSHPRYKVAPEVDPLIRVVEYTCQKEPPIRGISAWINICPSFPAPLHLHTHHGV